MSTFPVQTTTVPQVLSPDVDVHQLQLQLKEAQWWALWPGEPGWNVPLHEYLGFTEQEWRSYAISARRAW